MYHDPFNILHVSKVVYRINLGELAELINKHDSLNSKPGEMDKYFMALACGHELSSMNIPISTLAVVYGIDPALLAIQKARYVDGTLVKFSPQLCQQFIIDQLYRLYHQIFSSGFPAKKTALMDLINYLEGDHALYFAMIRAVADAHDQKLEGDDFYKYVIAALLEQFRISRKQTIEMLRNDPVHRYMDWEQFVDNRISVLAYWYQELNRLNDPEAELPDFGKLLDIECQIFSNSIDQRIDDDEPADSSAILILQDALETAHEQFVNQAQGIFFWSYRSE